MFMHADLKPGPEAIARTFAKASRGFIDSPEGRHLIAKSLRIVRDRDGGFQARALRATLDVIRCTA